MKFIPLPLLSSVRRATVRVLIPLAVLGASTAPTPARAQTESTAQHGIFIDTIDVNLVNIEVTAVDDDGNPVTDLTRDDFTVTEDGEPVDISHFFVVEDGRRRDASTGAEKPTGPEYEDSMEVTEPRFVIILVDQRNLGVTHRKRILDQLEQQLDQLLEPVDRVLVVSQNHEIRVEQPFTRDRALIDDALYRITDVAAADIRNAEARRLQRQILNAPSPQGGGGQQVTAAGFDSGITPVDEARASIASVESLAGQIANETRRTLNALDRFVKSMAGLPGRKAVIYVSDGLELRPAESLFRVWEDKYRSIAGDAGVTSVDFIMERLDLNEPFGRVLASAGANRVAFYTVEGGNERLDFGGISAEASTSISNSTGRFADGDRRRSMERLAFETGGVALTGGGNVRALLDRLEQDFGHYYSLGYSSPHRGDGKYHRVRVEVHRKGIELRYLDGYRDKTPDERMTDETLAALLFDVGENPLEIQVELGEETREKKKDRYTVPVMVKVPLSKLVLVPQGDSHQGRLSIFVAVQDELGRMSDPQKIDVPVEIPNDQLLTAMSQTAGYATRLAMRGGSQKIAIGVKDELAAVDSTLNLSVRIGQAAQ